MRSWVKITIVVVNLTALCRGEAPRGSYVTLCEGTGEGFATSRKSRIQAWSSR
jgi:hypothetical protein